MKKFLLAVICFCTMLLSGLNLAANASYYGGGYVGGYGNYGNYGGGYNRGYNYGGNSQYYYRPTPPITPAMTRNNIAPARTVSCIGTSSYISIGGGQVMPCESAAATRIRKSSSKISTNNHYSRYDGTTYTTTNGVTSKKMPKIQYTHNKMPKLSQNRNK